MQEFNILITSARRRVSLTQSFQLALKELGVKGQVLTADAGPFSAARLAGDR